MNKVKEAAQWMWEHRGQDIWWRPPVLTSSNPDKTAPSLSVVEAESLFRILDEKALIFPFVHPTDKKTAYLINELKEEEWGSFLRHYNGFYRYLLHPVWKVFRSLTGFIIWLASVIIASFIGAWINSLFT